MRAAVAIGAAVVLSTAAAAQADPPRGAVLTVRVSRLRSSDGQVGCMLFASPKGFPADPSAAAQKRWCPIHEGASTCAFDPIPAGTYAVACFHDENGNGKLDRGLFGIPKEGTAASNDAKGFMGPPSFEKAMFRFAGVAATLDLHMEY